MLAVLYLLFNEGYAASAGRQTWSGTGLCREAIRLARVLADADARRARGAALLALMLLHDARRTARLDASGDLVTLEDQDRVALGPGRDRGGRWVCSTRRCRSAVAGPLPGAGAIAACHATAATAGGHRLGRIAACT